MTALITEYPTYDSFAREWDDSEQDTRMLWQLLGQLEDDEILIRIPEWLAEENVGYVDGATPTTFVGRIDRDTEKAILFADSASARPLMKLAHRIQNLEDGLENAGDDEDRREWLEDRHREKRREFEKRDAPSLQEEWLPKSQLVHAVRRV